MEKWLIPGLRQEKYKMSLVVPESKEILKTNKNKQTKTIRRAYEKNLGTYLRSFQQSKLE